MNSTELRSFTSKYNSHQARLINKSEVLSNDNSLQVDSLWDTGATITAISEKVVNDLMLSPIGQRLISTPSGKKQVNKYLLTIKLPNDVIFTDFEVCDSDIGEQGFDLLIGMDIIGEGDFAVSNYRGVTTFTFRMPSQKEADYAKETRLRNLTGTHGKGKRTKKRKRNRK